MAWKIKYRRVGEANLFEFISELGARCQAEMSFWLKYHQNKLPLKPNGEPLKIECVSKC